MAKKDHRRNKSMCEISMMLVANIISLSSVRFPGPCFTTNHTPQDHETHVALVGKDTTTSATKLSNESQRSQRTEGTKKPRSYLMKPEKVGPTIVRQEINDANVDISAENYISHVRGKIEKDVNNTATTTKRFSSAAMPPSASSSRYS